MSEAGSIPKSQGGLDLNGTRRRIRTPYWRWGLLAFFQLALIAIPLADRLHLQLTGTEVTLALEPVDPRDLLRGDYVILNLSVHTLSRELPGADADFGYGDTIFVALQTDEDGIAQPVEVARDKAALDGLVLKGVVEYPDSDQIHLSTGMDAFFVQEGDGLEIETLPAERVQLVAVVSEDGRAMPLRLLVDGKVFKSDGAF